MKITNTIFLSAAAFLIILGVVLWSDARKGGDGNSATANEQTAVQRQIDSMSLRDKIASLLIVHIAGTSTSTLAAFVAEYHPGGLILMDDNIPATIPRLQQETDAIQGEAPEGFPLFIAIDQEGCTVRRLKSDMYPCPKELKAEPVENTEAAFRARSELLARGGINLNFGIVADVTDDTSSFIYPRVFGGDPSQVAERVAAAVQGTEGITLSTLKHFPGHGETEGDSHKTIPSVDLTKGEWASRDAPPFAAGIAVGADFLMFGQLTYTAVDSDPATLSDTWHRIAADELGFKGITITDDMFMLQQSGDVRHSDPVENAVAALKAGNTMLLYVTDHGPGTDLDIAALINGIAAAVQNGKLAESVIDENVEKTLMVRTALH